MILDRDAPAYPTVPLVDAFNDTNVRIEPLSVSGLSVSPHNGITDFNHHLPPNALRIFSAAYVLVSALVKSWSHTLALSDRFLVSVLVTTTQAVFVSQSLPLWIKLLSAIPTLWPLFFTGLDHRSLPLFLACKRYS